MRQHCDPGPGEAALPDPLCPCHHVEPDVAVKNEAGTNERCDKEIDVNPQHVLELNETERGEDQTHGHPLMRIFPLHLHQDHKSERVHGCQHPSPHQYAVGAAEWQDVTVVERPADCCVGVHHHEGDGEDGTAVGGDGDSHDQLAEQPRHPRTHCVTDHCGQVEDEEDHVCCQGVGQQQVTSLPTQGTGQEDARQEERVGYQGGQSDDS